MDWYVIAGIVRGKLARSRQDLDIKTPEAMQYNYNTYIVRYNNVHNKP